MSSTPPEYFRSEIGTRALRAAQVSATASLRDALMALDRGALGMALAVSGDGVLEGVLTDGNVRRALLAGASLDSPLEPYLRRDFISVQTGAARAAVLDLMQARQVGQVPIVDSRGRLTGLHTLHAILTPQELSNWVILMAGGRGERLRPLTDHIPKPMVPVAGRPILERIVLHLVGFGIRRVFISVNYRADMIEDYFGDGSAFGCRIEYLREEKALGTGGSLSLLQQSPKHPLLVFNGDLLTQVDIGRLLAFHAAKQHKVTIAVHEYTHTVPYGVVRIDEDRILSIEEKPTHCWPTNAGIYVLDPELLKRVPRDTVFPITALVQTCLEQHESVGAFRIEEEWFDVGQHQDLRRARGLRVQQ